MCAYTHAHKHMHANILYFRTVDIKIPKGGSFCEWSQLDVYPKPDHSVCFTLPPHPTSRISKFRGLGTPACPTAEDWEHFCAFLGGAVLVPPSHHEVPQNQLMIIATRAVNEFSDISDIPTHQSTPYSKRIIEPSVFSIKTS